MRCLTHERALQQLEPMRRVSCPATVEGRGRQQLQLNLDVGKGPEPDDTAQFPSELT